MFHFYRASAINVYIYIHIYTIHMYIYTQCICAYICIYIYTHQHLFSAEAIRWQLRKARRGILHVFPEMCMIVHQYVQLPWCVRALHGRVCVCARLCMRVRTFTCVQVWFSLCACFQRCACECRKECVFVENIESMRARVNKREECMGEHVHAKERPSERDSKKQQAFTQRKSEDEPDWKKARQRTRAKEGG